MGARPSSAEKEPVGSSGSISTVWEHVIGGSSVTLWTRRARLFVFACFMRLL